MIFTTIVAASRVSSAAISIAVILACSCSILAASQKTYLIFTIDTETSAGCGGTAGECRPVPIERRVLGRTKHGDFGIGMMMNMLEKHGMRATFFVNAFLADAHPEASVKKFVKQIIERGHDVHDREQL